MYTFIQPLLCDEIMHDPLNNHKISSFRNTPNISTCNHSITTLVIGASFHNNTSIKKKGQKGYCFLGRSFGFLANHNQSSYLYKHFATAHESPPNSNFAQREP